MRNAAYLMILGTGLLSACETKPVAEGGACKESPECVTGLECASGVCAMPKPDPPEPPPPKSRAGRALKDSKGAGKTAQDGVDKRMNDLLGK